MTLDSLKPKTVWDCFSRNGVLNNMESMSPSEPGQVGCCFDVFVVFVVGCLIYLNFYFFFLFSFSFFFCNSFPFFPR